MLVKKESKEKLHSRIRQSHQLMNPCSCFTWIYLVQSISKKRYCIVIVDDFTRFSWTFFLHSKYEASQLIINHIKAVDNNSKWNVKKIRSDNGTEFKNSIIKEFCNEKGITRTFSAPRTPQQIGVWLKGRIEL